MSTRTRIVAVLTSLLFSSQLISAPSVMAEGQVVDVCANKSTGKVREIQSGNCKYTEWSIGAKAITPGKTYPSGMRSKMANRWFAVRVAASRAGYSLIMTSGFRRLVDQKYLYGKAIEKYGSKKEAAKFVLPPKYSMHPWGLAIDINRNKGSKSGAKWVELNGWKWGLCRRYDNEFWHFEPLVAPGEKCPPRQPNALSAIPDGYWDK